MKQRKPWESCLTCAAHWVSTPHLTGACASVGIEHGKSTMEMLDGYFAAFHQRVCIWGDESRGQ